MAVQPIEQTAHDVAANQAQDVAANQAQDGVDDGNTELPSSRKTRRRYWLRFRLRCVFLIGSPLHPLPVCRAKAVGAVSAQSRRNAHRQRVSVWESLAVLADHCEVSLAMVPALADRVVRAKPVRAAGAAGDVNRQAHFPTPCTGRGSQRKGPRRLWPAYRSEPG